MDKPTPAPVAHTPGPWEALLGDDDRSYHIVQESTGGLIAYTEDTFGYAEADRRNAIVMAAAPDMLAALKETTALLERICIEEGQWPEEILDAAHAAIAKAEKGE